MTGSGSRGRLLALPLLAIPAAAVLAAVGSSGWLFIDDAYITFRYAENLARGLGFVYNPGERVLGTTTPLYCLWLALLHWAGVPTLALALGTGILAAGLSGILVWRLGHAFGRDRAGYAAGLVLVSFPRFWLAAASGMETTLAAALALLALMLDYRKKPVGAGLCLAGLVLTRPDAAALAAAILGVRWLFDRKAALIEAGAFLLALLPWTVFGWLYFGSPLPHSIAAKRLIHPFPWEMVLAKELKWFVSEPGLIAVSALWLCGAGWIAARKREALALTLWLIFFLAGLAASHVGPFFWYRTPLVPAYFLVAFLGAEALAERLREPWQRPALAGLSALLLGLFLAPAPAAFRQGLDSLVAKERVYEQMAERIQELGRPGDKVFTGDVGVLGYRLKDFYLLDSSGINSLEVFRLRLADRKQLLLKSPGYRFDWWGSAAWSREVIQGAEPRFIASDVSYLHLKELIADPEFQALYPVDRAFRRPEANYVLLVRKEKPRNPNPGATP